MSVYLDANILIALFVPDPLTARATALVSKLDEAVTVSDVAALELASTVARKVRAGDMSPRDGRAVLANFDAWVAAVLRADMRPSDVVVADSIVRRLDINLHGMDAIHVAIATRIEARLLTLDAKMKANAKRLGLPVL